MASIDLTANISFYMETETHQWMLNQNENNESVQFYMDDGERFILHVIDQPMCAAFQRKQDKSRVKLFVSNEMGIFEDSPDLEICISSADRKSEIEYNSGAIGGNPVETLMAFLNGGMILRNYLSGHNLTTDFSGIDPQMEGILVTVEEDELKFRRVSGKDRPDMACTELFGGVQMMRPYMDEIMESNMLDLMPVDEKIQLAENGDEDMMLAVYMAYLNGDGVEEDPQKAVTWLQKLADMDHSAA